MCICYGYMCDMIIDLKCFQDRRQDAKVCICIEMVENPKLIPHSTPCVRCRALWSAGDPMITIPCSQLSNSHTILLKTRNLPLLYFALYMRQGCGIFLRQIQGLQHQFNKCIRLSSKMKQIFSIIIKHFYKRSNLLLYLSLVCASYRQLFLKEKQNLLKITMFFQCSIFKQRWKSKISYLLGILLHTNGRRTIESEEEFLLSRSLWTNTLSSTIISTSRKEARYESIPKLGVYILETSFEFTVMIDWIKVSMNL